MSETPVLVCTVLHKAGLVDRSHLFKLNSLQHLETIYQHQELNI